MARLNLQVWPASEAWRHSTREFLDQIDHLYKRVATTDYACCIEKVTSERKLPPLPPRPAQELLDQSPREMQDYVEAADAHLAEKLRELREAKRQVHPFRRKKKDRKKDEKNRARNKPGRKPGHARDSRAEPQHVDEEVHADVADMCPKCAGDIEETSTYVQLQEDVVINVVVRRVLNPCMRMLDSAF